MTAGANTTPQRGAAAHKHALTGVLHIFALNAIAVAQPLLDLLGRQAEFFVAHGALGSDLLVLALILLVALPTIMTGIDYLAWRIGPGTHNAVHITIVAVYSALIAAHALARILDLPLPIHATLSLTLGGAVAVSYYRSEGVRSFFTLLAPAPIVIGLLFVFVSGASGIVFADTVEATPGREARQDVDVVLVIFDELPTQTLLDDEGDIDNEAFPGFARLASLADWYPNATTTSGATHVAVPTILAGVEPDHAAERLPVASDYPFNIFTALAPTHDIHASEVVTSLCPSDVCGRAGPGGGPRFAQMILDSTVAYAHLISPENVRDWLPPIDDRWTGFIDLSVEDLPTREAGLERRRFEEFNASLGTLEPPGLYVMHSILPHRPWVYTEEGRLYSPSPVAGFDTTHPGTWYGDDYAVGQGYERHRTQLAFADTLLGDLLDQLEDVGLLERSLLVVTADHGINFGAYEYARTVTDQTYQQILPVPLFIKRPGQTTGSIVELPVENLDVLATVLDVVGHPDADTTDGMSIFGSAYAPRQKRYFDQTGEHAVGHDTIDLLASRAEVQAILDRSFDPDAAPWIGTVLGGVPLPPSSGAASITNLEAFEDVDLAGEPLPLRVVGRLAETTDSNETALLLAVNGTIVASGRTYSDGADSGYISLFLPASALHDGANELRLLVLPPAGRPVELQLTGARGETRPDEYRLGTVDGALVIENDRGGGIPLADDWLRGGVDSDQRTDEGRVITGWAFDEERIAPVDLIFVFSADGRLVQTVRPKVARLDVADAFGVDGIDPAGFTIVVDSHEAEEIRLVAVAGGRAAEIVQP